MYRPIKPMKMTEEQQYWYNEIQETKNELNGPYQFLENIQERIVNNDLPQAREYTIDQNLVSAGLSILSMFVGINQNSN